MVCEVKVLYPVGPYLLQYLSKDACDCSFVTQRIRRVDLALCDVAI